METLTLGIDFGSKNVRSCVYHGRSNTLEVVQKPTPNQVSFGNQICVGERAIKRNRITGYTTILGRCWDEIVDENLLSANIKQLNNVNNHPEYDVTYRGEKLSVKPEILASLVFDEVVRQSGKTIRNAVIAIPHSFNPNQRSAVLNSAKLSNLNVLTLVNKTTAAAVAFHHLTNQKYSGNVLIYHLGSDSFDFAVCNFGSHSVEVLNSSGGYKLGGDSINDKIYDLICFRLNLNNLDVKIENELLESIEEAKIDLLFSTVSKISDYNSRIEYDLSRDEFNALVYNKIVSTTIDLIKKSLQEWDLEIGGVILTGNTCKIPILEQIIDNEFGLLAREFKDEHLVVKGTSIIGALITKTIKKQFCVKEGIKTSIILNKQYNLYERVVPIDLLETKRIELEVCTNGFTTGLSANFDINFGGILKQKNKQESNLNIKNDDKYSTIYINQRNLNNEMSVFQKMQDDKEYLSSQNTKHQQLKESLNSLKDLLDSCEDEIMNLPVPDKHKRIFLNFKTKVFRMKITQNLKPEDITYKEDCVNNYLDYLRNY